MKPVRYIESPIVQVGPPVTSVNWSYPNQQMQVTLDVAPGATVIASVHSYGFEGAVCFISDNLVGNYTVLVKPAGSVENGGMLAVFWNHPGGTVTITGKFGVGAQLWGAMHAVQYMGLEEGFFAVKNAAPVWTSNSITFDDIPLDYNGELRRNGLGITAFGGGTNIYSPAWYEAYANAANASYKTGLITFKGFNGLASPGINVSSGYVAQRCMAALFARRIAVPDWVWRKAAGGSGAVSLVIAEAGHSHAAEALTLSTDWLLSLQEALHGHLSDNVVLDASSAANLSVQEASHTQLAAAADLTAAAYLAIQEAVQAQLADNVGLSTTGSTSLSVAEALHAHGVESLTLTLQTWLAVADALQAHAAENLTLGASGIANLSTQEATHGHLADTVTLSSVSNLTIAEALHAQYADNLTLVIPGDVTLTPQDILNIVEALLTHPDFLTLKKFLALKDS